ncbi:hypothetical protein Tco_0151396 [Tanacetum coccineum]
MFPGLNTPLAPDGVFGCFMRRFALCQEAEFEDYDYLWFAYFTGTCLGKQKKGKGVIFRILAWKIISFAAMADASAKIEPLLSQQSTKIFVKDTQSCYLLAEQYDIEVSSRSGQDAVRSVKYATYEKAKQSFGTVKDAPAAKLKATEGLEAAKEAMGKKCDEAVISGDRGVYTPEFNRFPAFTLIIANGTVEAKAALFDNFGIPLLGDCKKIFKHLGYVEPRKLPYAITPLKGKQLVLELQFNNSNKPGKLRFTARPKTL